MAVVEVMRAKEQVMRALTSEGSAQGHGQTETTLINLLISLNFNNYFTLNQTKLRIDQRGFGLLRRAVRNFV